MKRSSLAVLVVVLLAAGGIAGAAAVKDGSPPDRGAWQRAAEQSEESAAAPSAAASPSAAAADTPVGDHGLRVAGNDRFETAVAISQIWTPEDTLTVFLATGLNFPDALAGGASTLLEGPILLVTKDTLPQVTADEITRLQPCLVVAFGGTGTISDAVIQQAQALTAGC